MTGPEVMESRVIAGMVTDDFLDPLFYLFWKAVVDKVGKRPHGEIIRGFDYHHCNSDSKERVKDCYSCQPDDNEADKNTQ
jgi:hypothetical protein